MIKYIRETIGLTEFSEEAIENVLCIFLCNDFAISGKVGDHDWSSCENNEMRGLYELGCILNLDCVGNTIHQFTSMEDGFGLVIRAGCDIKQGEEITHTYVDPLDPFLKRQELLKLGKFFCCIC